MAADEDDDDDDEHPGDGPVAPGPGAQGGGAPALVARAAAAAGREERPVAQEPVEAAVDADEHGQREERHEHQVGDQQVVADVPGSTVVEGSFLYI